MIKLIKYYYPDTTTGGGDGDGKTIKIKDSRKNDAVTGKPVADTDRKSVEASVPLMQKIITSAKSNGVDPYNALAVALQETNMGGSFKGMGSTADNPFMLTHNYDKNGKWTNYAPDWVNKDNIDASMKLMKQKMDAAQKSGKNTDEDVIQSWNGYGKLGTHMDETQGIKSWYGIPVDKAHNIDMNTNPVYGKRVTDLRDNILKQNPDIVKMVGDATAKPQTNSWNTGLQSANMLDNKNVNYVNSPAITGGEDPKDTAPKAPANYKPLTVGERTQWNGFLDYLDKNKMGGNPALDKRDQTLGLNYFNKYKAANPNFTLTPDDVQRVQYEQYMLRKGDSFPTMKPEELQFIRNGLTPAYLNRGISPADNWLGSLTSKEYYPSSIRLEANGNRNFGNDIESYVRSLNDPSIAAKFPITPK